MKSIIQLTGSGAFPRVRIGIGPKPLNMDLSAFVMQSFSRSELGDMMAILEHSVKYKSRILYLSSNQMLSITN